MIKLYEETYSCSACGGEGRGDGSLHIAIVHLINANPYRCHCGVVFVWSNELSRHIVENHITVEFKCKICGNETNGLTEINEHIRQHQRDGEI